jgi:hypothetical protein
MSLKRKYQKKFKFFTKYCEHPLQRLDDDGEGPAPES